MNNEIKEILENIKCPQLGYDEYGKWGALPLNVRMTLKRLCDYVVSCDDCITNLQKENLKLISENEVIKNIKYTVDEVIYKSRNDKAIEKLKSVRIYGLQSGKTLISALINDVLDILEGDDENGN